MSSSNPLLLHNIYKTKVSSNSLHKMEIAGTINKTFILLFITVISATVIWVNHFKYNNSDFNHFIIFSSAPITIVLALLTTIKTNWTSIIAPIFAVFEGFLLGGLSAFVEEYYSGLAVHAVLISFGILVFMMLVYKMKLLIVNRKYLLGLFIASGGLIFMRIFISILSVIGIKLLFNYELLNALISLGMIFIASLTFIADFNFIEKAVQKGFDKNVEWFGAFCLLTTLFWLYIEVLFLLLRIVKGLK
jgi:uncharacterized YccA/Bax inhibitor family protein